MSEFLHSFLVRRTRHFRKKAVEILGRLFGDRLDRYAADLGESACFFDHVGRFVTSAAIFSRREVGRIGLDQNAVWWQLRRNCPQGIRVFKGQDAGEGNKMAERHCAAGEFTTASKTMQYGRKSPL